MSLVHKPEMTEKNLAAHRAGGACGSPGREIAADAKDGRTQPAPIVAPHQRAFQGEKRGADS
jgi:hypothetical protein